MPTIEDDVRPKNCSCWVATRPASEQFIIRRGAHNPECPAFSPSLDPVDNLKDAQLRCGYEMSIARAETRG